MAFDAVEYKAPRFQFRLPNVREALARKLVRWGLRLSREANSVDFAKREMEIAGLFEKDSDYGGMLGDAVLDMMRLFSMEGHSGFSAGMATSIFEKVSRYEPLTPLTGADDEWTEVGRGEFQNRRCGHVFKGPDGAAYDIEGRIFREPDGACFTSFESRVPVTFPYVPTREYVDRPASADAV